MVTTVAKKHSFLRTYLMQSFKVHILQNDYLSYKSRLEPIASITTDVSSMIWFVKSLQSPQPHFDIRQYVQFATHSTRNIILKYHVMMISVSMVTRTTSTNLANILTYEKLYCNKQASIWSTVVELRHCARCSLLYCSWS